MVSKDPGDCSQGLKSQVSYLNLTIYLLSYKRLHFRSWKNQASFITLYFKVLLNNA
jgi:hypothetical protein